MSKKKHKRRRIYVDIPVQTALLLKMVWHWLMVMSMMLCVLVAVEFVSSGMKISLGEAVNAVWARSYTALAVLMLIAPLIGYDLIKLSHRFAGPMVTLRREMQRLAAGEACEEIHFRKGDFWTDLPESFNGIRARMEELERQVAEAGDDEPALETASAP